MTSQWASPPQSGDGACVHLLLEACAYVLSRRGLTPAECDAWGLLLRKHLCERAEQDLARIAERQELGRLDSFPGTRDAALRICRIAAQRAAAYAARVAQRPGSLAPVAVLEGFERACAGIEERALGMDAGADLPRTLDLGALEALAQGLDEFPFFDGMVRDKDIEGLAGAPDIEETIFRPVQLSHVPDAVDAFEEIAAALRHCDHACTLLMYQRRQIRHGPLLQLALIHHLFIRVLPVPLPPKAAGREATCIWQKPLRYETQVDLLRLLHSVMRHYVAVSLCLPANRSLDSSRILTVAAMAAIADALMRRRACDVPSLLCLHFNGEAPQTPVFTQQPFGVDVAALVVATEDMFLPKPELCTCRTSILDYFVGQRELVPDDHVIFQFEQSMSCGSVATLLNQVTARLHFELPLIEFFSVLREGRSFACCCGAGDRLPPRPRLPLCRRNLFRNAPRFAGRSGFRTTMLRSTSLASGPKFWIVTRSSRSTATSSSG